MKVTVLSWNIWQGYHLPEIIAFLKKNPTDIIGLQEVIEQDDTNTAARIAKELGYYSAYFRAIDKTRLGFPQGNAIISRHPIQKSTRHFLSDASLYQQTAETEPRIAVESKITIEEQSLSVFTVHLAYSHMFRHSAFRDMQVANLINLLPKEKTILLGDFNSHPDSPYMKQLTDVMKNTDPSMLAPTWTVYPFDYKGFKETELIHRLDYIFTTPDISTRFFRVGESKGSDHLPVLATLEV